MHVLCHNIFCNCLQSRDVIENVDATTVRCEDQIVVAWMHQNVIDPHHRKVRHEPFPTAAIVERDEEAELCSCVEKFRVSRILPDSVDVSVRWKIRADVSPTLPVVSGYVDVRSEVVALVTVDRNVGGGRVVS